MLEAVGHAHAVNPDKELRRAAAARGWPVLVFTKPVALRSRVPLDCRTGRSGRLGGALARWAAALAPVGGDAEANSRKKRGWRT